MTQITPFRGFGKVFESCIYISDWLVMAPFPGGNTKKRKARETSSGFAGFLFSAPPC